MSFNPRISRLTEFEKVKSSGERAPFAVKKRPSLHREISSLSKKKSREQFSGLINGQNGWEIGSRAGKARESRGIAANQLHSRFINHDFRRVYAFPIIIITITLPYIIVIATGTG